jgi:hypothetical protein
VLTFIVEAIDTIDTGALMVASEHEKILWIFDLVSKHQTDGLNRLFSTIDVISQKEIISITWKTCIFEQFNKVGVLTVNVA